MAEQHHRRTGPKPQDLTGQKFGHLTAIRLVSEPGKLSRWLCECDCGSGKESLVLPGDLRRGNVTSCGCSRQKHGHTSKGGVRKTSPTYHSWAAMIKRCTNPADPYFPDYGGRGIIVCERWTEFANFLADMGERPAGHTIDRIDNSKGYEPGNVKWSTDSDQARNRRSTVTVEYQGSTISVIALAEKTGIPYEILRWRIAHDWDVERAVSTPPDNTKREAGRSGAAAKWQ